jgi:hypothetical protein
MDDQALFIELKLLLEKVGLELREQRLESDDGRAQSGLVRIRERKIFYLDDTLPLRDKLRVLVSALKKFDLSGVYVSPYLREMIEAENEKEK